ncbi:MAG: hypothetical protein WC375_03295 [Methanomassiliicoccales archaeon]|jgi:hypothetical protein
MNKIKKCKPIETISFTANATDSFLKSNDFICGINMPDALNGKQTHCLPPYARRKAFLVDSYPSCPENWMRSEGRITSYFVPIQEGKGLWLDFNRNDNKTHHVAIVISIQGINPITGMPCTDPQLEQYIDECPKHKIKFGPERYCEKCGYKWPKQNYICTTGTPDGMLWLDGFRSINGIVRQYILTQEKIKGVASNIIGNQRVYAIGVSFFLSKEKRPAKVRQTISYHNWKPFASTGDTVKYGAGGSSCGNFGTTTKYKFLGSLGEQKKEASDFSTLVFSRSVKDNKPRSETLCYTSNVECCSASPANLAIESEDNGQFEEAIGEIFGASQSEDADHVKVKTMEVGAGAKIDQFIYDDPKRLDFWHDQPEAIIVINYCTEEEATAIINNGMKDLTGDPEGYLKNIPVGN